MIEVFQAHPDFLGFRVDTGELTAEVIEHGGIVTRIEVPDRRGDFANVLLGCPTIADYLGPHPHFNCLVGRYANRMTNARFELDGTLHKLDANLPPHHLHGGRAGFGLRRWTGTAEDDGVLLKLKSPDGESGYPGNLTVEARYRFTGRDMSLEFRAVTDAPTPVSLSSHHYYNLTGMAGSTIDDHEVVIDADHFLPVSAALTQLGEIRGVSGTPFDLRRTVVLRDAFRAADAQMRLADGGFDHTFVLKPGFQRAAVVRHPDSGRTLTVTTDQPGVQFYTANNSTPPAVTVDAIRSAAPSAWRPSNSRTHPTTPTIRTRSCGRGCRSGRERCFRFRWVERCREARPFDVSRRVARGSGRSCPSSESPPPGSRRCFDSRSRRCRRAMRTPPPRSTSRAIRPRRRPGNA